MALTLCGRPSHAVLLEMLSHIAVRNPGAPFSGHVLLILLLDFIMEMTWLTSSLIHKTLFPGELPLTSPSPLSSLSK